MATSSLHFRPGPHGAQPLSRRLLGAGGLAALVDRARATGFEPLAEYSAPCDLCTHARWHLLEAAPSPDLGPAAFYDRRSLPGFAADGPQKK